jgi:hypothetical protein
MLALLIWDGKGRCIPPNYQIQIQVSGEKHSVKKICYMVNRHLNNAEIIGMNFLVTIFVLL